MRATHSKSGWVSKLWYSLQYNQVSIVKQILMKGADINHRFRQVDRRRHNGQTAISVAVRKNYKEMVEMLLKEGCDVNCPDMKGETPIFVAIRNGKKPAVKMLVEANCDVNYLNHKGQSVIFSAVQRGQKDLLEYLISVGCDLDVSDHTSTTPLMYALQLNTLSNLSFVNTRRSATHAQIDLIKLIVMSTNNLDMRDTIGSTALHKATIECAGMFGNFIIPLIMIQQGASTKVCDCLGQSTLYVATHYDFRYFSRSFMRLLVEAGLDIQGEKWLFQALPSCLQPFEDMWEEIRYLSSNPRSLQSLCRISIRETLGRGKIWEKVDALSLPNSLKDFIKFKEYDISDVTQC